MSTRTVKETPDDQLVELTAERDRYVEERGRLKSAVKELQDSLERIPDRRRELALAELRGRKSEESAQQIDIDEEQAEQEIANKKARIEAAEVAEREILAEIDGLYDTEIAFFTRAAKEASERAWTAAERAREALREAQTASEAAERAWIVPRNAAKRAGRPMPRPAPFPPNYPEVDAHLAHLMRNDPFWPGGRRDKFDCWLAEHGRALGIDEDES
jgi:hypothetical protein